MAVAEIAGKVIVTELIKKTLPSLFNKVGLIKEEVEHFFDNKFSKYIDTKYSKLDLSTSQLFRNSNFKISELYVPLTLIDSKTHNRTKINKYPSSLFNKKNKILINDTAGMGKSTLLKMIFRYAIDEDKIIPFYIDMKSLIKKEKVISVIDSFIQDFPSYINIPKENFVNNLFENNAFLFLFDGADEVPDNYKNEVYGEINRFIDISNNSNFIIATRDEDKILSSFNSFVAFNIKELSKNEAYKLIKNYDVSNEISNNLILEINKIENEQVFEFLKNPLLVTLLFNAYSYSKKIPLKKNIFFKLVYQSLYENHDATKIGYLSREKCSGLDIDEFEIVLSQLAFHGRIREKLEYTIDELVNILQNINESMPTIDFNARDFVTDLISRVPLLKRDGQNFIWQHKSIQEYFFIQFLFKVLDEKERISFAKKILYSDNISKYRLIFDILYDEDTEYFHDNFTLPVLNEYINDTADNCDCYKSLDYFYKYYITNNVNDYEKNEVSFEPGEWFKEFLNTNLSKKEIKLFESKYSLNIITRTVGIKRNIISYLFYYKQQIIIETLFNKKYDFIFNLRDELEEDEENKIDLSLFHEENKFIENITKKSKKEMIFSTKNHLRRCLILNRKKAIVFLDKYKENKNKKNSILKNLKNFESI